MSAFTELAQQAYDRYHDRYHDRAPGAEAWTLPDALAATLPFLQQHAGNLDAMPGLRAAFRQATPAEWQAMWTTYCDLGDLLYALERAVRTETRTETRAETRTETREGEA
jgi:hypothetical protein